MASAPPSKRRKLTPPTSQDEVPLKRPSKPSTEDFYRQAAKWNLEQDYEQRPRKGKKREKERTRLPIKTAEGIIEHVPEAEKPEEEPDRFLDTDSDEEEKETPTTEPISLPKVSTKQQV